MLSMMNDAAKRADRALNTEMKRQDMLFARGAMEDAPCFCCGYNGPGYYQSEQHPCAARHHKLVHNAEFSGRGETDPQET